MRWVSLSVVAVQVVVVVWMGYEMFRNYGRYGRADHGNSLAWGAALLVLLTTGQQVIRVLNDPSRTSGWVLLGLGIVCSLFAVVASVRMRRRAYRH